ncbi:hypothetical protein D3C83_165720 [compost metagenome]
MIGSDGDAVSACGCAAAAAASALPATAAGQIQASFNPAPPTLEPGTQRAFEKKVQFALAVCIASVRTTGAVPSPMIAKPDQ